MELTEGTLIAGRFRLTRELGRGAMGAVWLAHHTGLDVPCAVKFIHPELRSTAEDTEVRARFEREARAIARLRSPHVVQVLDYGTAQDGTPYLAMEYLIGENLGDRLRRVGRLGPRETVHVVTQIARALARAHAAGLVHRDLKPENVFLTGDDDPELVKVLDFGVAKGGPATPEVATRTGAVLGTPHFMSPEQAQGARSLDHRSDLWSLGVLTYTCLTGQRPFCARVFGDLLLQLLVAPLPVPSAIAPQLGPGFDAWWAKACARDVAERFQSAKEQADALAECLSISRASSRPSAGSSAPCSAPARPEPTLIDGTALMACPAVPDTLPFPTRSPSRAPRPVAARFGTSAWWWVAPASLFLGGLIGLAAAGRLSGSVVAARSDTGRASSSAAVSPPPRRDAGAETLPRAPASRPASSAPRAPVASAAAPTS